MSEAVKISIHRALSELKTIGDRINKAIAEFNPVGVTQSDKPVNQIYKTEDFDKMIKSQYQAINDLITRRGLLKTKIVESNAKTEVEVGSKKMTVADAIVYKDLTIKIKEQLLNHLQRKHKELKASIEKTNEQVEENAQCVTEATLGEEKTLQKQKFQNTLIKKFREMNLFKLVDPIEVEKEITRLETEISDFKTDVDSRLSESNATTFIEI